MLTPSPALDRPGERVLARPCRYCGRSFTPTRPHQRHCRPSCRLAAFRTKAEQEAEAPGEPRALSVRVVQPMPACVNRLDEQRINVYKGRVAPLKLFTFALPDDLKAGLRQIREADGVSEAEQIRRGIRMWLESKGVLKTERKRAGTRKRS